MHCSIISTMSRPPSLQGTHSGSAATQKPWWWLWEVFIIRLMLEMEEATGENQPHLNLHTQLGESPNFSSSQMVGCWHPPVQWLTRTGEGITQRLFWRQLWPPTATSLQRERTDTQWGGLEAPQAGRWSTMADQASSVLVALISLGLLPQSPSTLEHVEWL